MTRELAYLLLICGLMVVPGLMQRLRIPPPLTCFLLGMALALSLPDLGHRDDAVHLLANLGISTLFLYAGLEVDLATLRRAVGPPSVYLLTRVLSVAVVVWLGWRYLELRWQDATLLALAIMFVVIKATDPAGLAMATGGLAVTLIALPLVLLALGRWIVPHASGSAFSLLVMVGFAAAFVTDKLGVE